MPDPSYTHKRSSTYADDAGQVVLSVTTATGNGELKYNQTIPVSTTNQVVPLIVFTRAVAQSYVFTATQPLTLKFNSTSAPTDTWVLAAGQSKMWMVSDSAIPLTADVAVVYATNASAVNTSQLIISVLTSS